MLVAFLLSIAAAHGARELEAAKRATALLRFVARLEDGDFGEFGEFRERARREQVERCAAADAIVRELVLAAPAETESARRLSDAVAAGRRGEVAWLAGRLQRSVEHEFEWEAVPRQRPQLA